MNYKKIAFVLCLVPMMSCAGDVQETIQQLEQEQLTIETELIALNDEIQGAIEKLDTYKEEVIKKSSCYISDDVFLKFLQKSLLSFNTGKDVFNLIKENKLFMDDFIHKDMYIIRMVVQCKLIERLMNKSRSIAYKVLTINKQLNDLYE